MKRLRIVSGILLAAFIVFGSITVSAQQINQKGSIQVKSDEAGFAEMARISIDNAINTALKKVPGKVLRAEIENQDGYLVYGVEIVKADHQIADVKIDAGNGKVLNVDQDHADKGGYKEGRENEGREEEDHENGRENEN